MLRPAAFTLALLLVTAGITQAGVCPADNVIEDPPIFQWTDQGNYLTGTLEIGPADLVIGSDTLTTRAYRQEGGEFSIPGPTITMTPGETYVLTFKNLLPREAPSPVHNEFKDPNITNIHTHGLHVSGETPSDDITRLINGGECGDYVYEVPWYHVGGTLWYHAHHHGSTYLQVSAGAFGLLIIDDAQDGIPADVAGMTERQLAVGFLDPAVAGTGGDTLISGTLAPTWTVNGLVGGNLCAPANEWQHWRLLLADRDARMKTVAVGPECEVALLARDGVWRTEVPLVLANGSIDLTGASRADLAVNCSADSALTVNGTTVAHIFADPNLPANTTVGPWDGGATGAPWSLPARPDYLRDLRAETNVENRTVNMGARTINGSKWDPDVPTFTIPTGAVQELTVKGATQHPYHQHVYHVQMNGACGAFEDGEYYDTIAGSCDVRFDLGGTSVYDGLTVMHCHILSHEDQGAMGWMDVVGGLAPPEFPDPGQQALYGCCDPSEPSETFCADYLDNDCDGLTDGSDPDCAGGGGDCASITNRDECNADPSCEWQGSPRNGSCVDASTCTITEDPELTCDDGADNDCDGFVDCADSDCAADPACQTGVCGDGICDPGEDCESCASDCDGVTGGKPANRYCCGNGVVEAPEGDGSICDGNF